MSPNLSEVFILNHSGPLQPLEMFRKLPETDIVRLPNLLISLLKMYQNVINRCLYFLENNDDNDNNMGLIQTF